MPKTLSRPAQAGTSPSTTSYFELMQQKAPKNGWVFVYLSNESNQPVFFDDFSVVQEHSRISEESHYYPYGLKIGSISAHAYNKLESRYGYQGDFSEEDIESGYDEFALRMYDPQLGKWNGVDPYDEFASPYIGMGNDPVNGVDPDGGSVLNFFDSPILNHFADAFGGALIGGIVGAIADKEGSRSDGALRGMAWGAGAGLAGSLGYSYIPWESIGNSFNWVPQTTNDVIAASREAGFWKSPGANIMRVGDIFEDAVIRSLGEKSNKTVNVNNTIPDLIRHSIVTIASRGIAISYLFPDANLVDVKFKSTLDLLEDGRLQLVKMIDYLSVKKGGWVVTSGSRKWDENLDPKIFGVNALTIIGPSNLRLNENLINYAKGKNVPIIVQYTETLSSNYTIDRNTMRVGNNFRIYPGRSPVYTKTLLFSGKGAGINWNFKR